MFGGPRQMMHARSLKAGQRGQTLSRLAGLFQTLLAWCWSLVVIILIVNTYTQVITPELTGQSVDCYLTPATASRLAGMLTRPGPASPGRAGQCHPAKQLLVRPAACQRPPPPIISPGWAA